MTEATQAPSADELFQKWLQFQATGAQTTASDLAAGHPHLIAALERRIAEHSAGHSTETEPRPAGRAPQAPDIPGYVVEAFLGGGGMGEVWRVRDRLDQARALKLVRSDRLSAAGQERFLAEARAMARLDHPHVAKVHHFDIHEGLPYYLMRPYPASLKDRLSEFQAHPKAAVRLMAAVADGVGHLHARGFVHRDLKPGNVLLDEAGQPAVSDFGLVKSLGGDPTSDPGSVAGGSSETHPTGARGSNTVLGAVLGTRAYMSPEQAAGRVDQANPRWDVWALGVMLHELLTGKLPPSSLAPERLLDPDEPDNPPPSSVKAGLDPRLERIVLKCLSRDPAGRYADGAAVAADVNRWLGRGSRVIKWAATLAGLVLLGGAIWAVAITPWRPQTPDLPPDPDRQWKDLRAQLQETGAVDLIGPTGEPRWQKVVAGTEFTKPYLEQDGTFSVDTSRVAHVLLLPELGIDSYRLDGEVKQLGGDSAARFGVSVGRETFAVPDGETAYHAEFVFNEDIAFAPGRPSEGQWEVVLMNRSEAQKRSSPFRWTGKPFPPQRRPSGYDWRALSITVTLPRLEWYWGTKSGGSLPRPLPPLVQDRLQGFAQLPREATPTFPPSGGVGLVVQGGNASFRNVRLTRLP